MKNLVVRVVGFFLLVMLTGCEFKSSSVKEFIPGVYARHFEGEFSKGNDTLIIEPFSGSTYTHMHHSMYQRIQDGKLTAPERKLTKLTAIYDERQEVLVENKEGLIISFDPSRRTLLFGKSVFEKIK